MLGRRNFLTGFGAAALGPLAQAHNAKVRGRTDLCFSPGRAAPLYENDSSTQIYGASLTKLLTAAVFLDNVKARHIKLDRDIYIGKRAIRGARGGWQSGLEGFVPAVQALQLMVCCSYNDVAYAIAQHIADLPVHEEKIHAAGFVPGTQEAFVSVPMAEKARMIGMNGMFWNASGLPPYDTDAPRSHYTHQNDYSHFNVTTASDLARLCGYLVSEHEGFLKYFSAPVIKIKKQGLSFLNINPLLENSQCRDAKPCEGVYGLKTGVIAASG